MTALADNFSNRRKEPAATESERAQSASTTVDGSEQEPVVVWKAANMMEAEIVRGRLESEQIPAYIRRDAVGGIYGLTVGGLAKADVLVPAPLAEKAIALLHGEETLPAEDLVDVEQPDVEQPDVEQPDVEQPDVENATYD